MSGMEPLFSVLTVGVVPQPTQVPPKPFELDDLQKIFFEASRDFPYAQFQVLPGDQGAAFMNTPLDRVLLQPQLLQVQTQIGTAGEATAERAREKVVTVLEKATERLGIRQSLACGIKVIANVPAPDGGARNFVANRLFSQADRIDDTLGHGYFGGGIKIFRLGEDNQKIEVLLIEPLVADDTLIYVDYDVQRNQSTAGLGELVSWIDGAFRFVSDHAIAFLEEAE